ncbi:hypothetical protein BBO99_00003501 [Phytophthora kernoviae]|uniref:Uncharacterized protein n=2 Tax=Phytophthora kernoviae TaxID=325452 RepID=A0A3R7MKU6_9STRA|nr:hypothetical protein G195_007005 [Phytophthora kernoviae 00238/432]KAG2528019.1 hypothetical protein JM16_003130 [Phytophthora kernoviae]KAG2529481.1 hypothetical protein JM18_002793 [Phytophthora kernoviae]RLN02756.1 hypothetical protein BBI17_003529 [Phytophthora kernoviae]RLN81699.1 hypothetical protein BBO99_00003501 [Phytophthora kernoviae]
MAYCGSIGSVSVLAIMSTDLFDEAQENPFLLQRSPSPSKLKLDSSRSPQRAGSVFNKGAELPLDDPSVAYSYRAPQGFLGTSPFKPSPQTLSVSPQRSPSRTVSFASPSTPRSILKRQSSIDSDSSTVTSIRDQQLQSADAMVTDSELHKLLYSLTRFGLANDAGDRTGANAITEPNAAGYTPRDQPTQSFGSNPLWFRGAPTDSEAFGSGPEGSADYSNERVGGAPARASAAKRRRSSKKSAMRQDPGSGSRGSVTFSTVKSLLRGGGLAGRTAIKATPVTQRKKSMGTISSRLKINQKFVRPTILTDAYHRVGEMKLGTRPIPARVKHIAFPQPWDTDNICDREETDAGMSSPKGTLKRNSFISLETLDKIGTRAACPVHLIDVEKPDYSQVSARVDSYNHVRSPKRGLRRPSTWLAGAALDARVAYYESH